MENETGTRRSKRVNPDGCADIIYTRSASEAHLYFVGPMTRFEDFARSPGTLTVGIRFRPGMWGDVLQVCGSELTDRIVPMDDLWGDRAHGLMRLLETRQAAADFVEILAAAVPAMKAKRSPLQEAIKLLELSHGRLSLDHMTRAAGLSARQLRRNCLQTTGLSPKLLARILRFRHAAELLAPMSGQHAGLAYECGYTDQSHLIADFQKFAGRTPREMLLAVPIPPGILGTKRTTAPSLG